MTAIYIVGFIYNLLNQRVINEEEDVQAQYGEFSRSSWRCYKTRWKNEYDFF